jgi:SOS-response transcriptional repressor LexA
MVLASAGCEPLLTAGRDRTYDRVVHLYESARLREGKGVGRTSEQGQPTPIQQRILEAIRKATTEQGFAPTIRELAERVNRPKSTVEYHLDRLEGKGQIVRLRAARYARARTIALANPGMQASPPPELVKVPFFSTPQAAATPEERPETTYALPRDLVGEGELLFMTRVPKDMDGVLAANDRIVIRRTGDPQAGDLVAVLGLDGELAVSRLDYSAAKARPAAGQASELIDAEDAKGRRMLGTVLTVVRSLTH